MTKNQWNGLFGVAVVLALAVGFMGGSLYEKRKPQSILNGVANKIQTWPKDTPGLTEQDEAAWFNKCLTHPDPDKCIITGEIK